MGAAAHERLERLLAAENLDFRFGPLAGRGENGFDRHGRWTTLAMRE